MKHGVQAARRWLALPLAGLDMGEKGVDVDHMLGITKARKVLQTSRGGPSRDGNFEQLSNVVSLWPWSRVSVFLVVSLFHRGTQVVWPW